MARIRSVASFIENYYQFYIIRLFFFLFKYKYISYLTGKWTYIWSLILRCSASRNKQTVFSTIFFTHKHLVKYDHLLKKLIDEIKKDSFKAKGDSGLTLTPGTLGHLSNFSFSFSISSKSRREVGFRIL